MPCVHSQTQTLYKTLLIIQRFLFYPLILSVQPDLWNARCMFSRGKLHGKEEPNTARVLFDTNSSLCPPDLWNGMGCFYPVAYPRVHRENCLRHPCASLSSHTTLLLLWLTLVMDDRVSWIPTIYSQRQKEVERAGKTLPSESNWILFNQDLACPGPYIWLDALISCLQMCSIVKVVCLQRKIYPGFQWYT